MELVAELDQKLNPSFEIQQNIFNKDRAFAISQAQLVLEKKISPPFFSVTENRKNAAKFLTQGDFTKALEYLELARDCRSGIHSFSITNPDKNLTPVFIRDARGCRIPAVLGQESFEAQIINAHRAAMDLVLIYVKGEEKISILEKQIQKMAINYLDKSERINLGKDNNNENSQKELSQNTAQEIKKIVELLEYHGIKDATKKLNIALGFQNFRDVHHNIVTLSSIKDQEDKTRVIAEVEIALKGLTQEQQTQYDDLIKSEEMSDLQKGLMTRYREQVFAGKHVIPTQTSTSIPAVRNAFEKTTMITDEKNILTEVLIDLAVATPACFIADNKNFRKNIVDANAKQVVNIARISAGRHDAIVHFNSLNSGPLGNENVKIAEESMNKANARFSATAFNGLRIFALANNLIGAEDALHDFANCIEMEPIKPIDKETKAAIKAYKALQYHIRPQGFLGRIMRSISCPSFEEALKDLGTGKTSLPVDFAAMLREAAALSNQIEQASATFRFSDRENLSLSLSTKLNDFTYSLRKLPIISQTDSVAEYFYFKKQPPFEIIIGGCDESVDEKGLSLIDQSSQKISQKLGIDIAKSDEVLVSAGHTQFRAGSSIQGGGAIGCDGVKDKNRGALPQSRKEILEGIIRASAKEIFEDCDLNFEEPQQDLASMLETIQYLGEGERIDNSQAAESVLDRVQLAMVEKEKQVQKKISKPKPAVSIDLNNVKIDIAANKENKVSTSKSTKQKAATAKKTTKKPAASMKPKRTYSKIHVPVSEASQEEAEH